MLLKQKMGSKENVPITIYTIRANDKFKNLPDKSKDECESGHSENSVKNISDKNSSGFHRIVVDLREKCENRDKNNDYGGHHKSNNSQILYQSTKI